MQYLPSFICQIIDAVAYQGDPTELDEAWVSWKEDYEAYYQRESDYNVSDEDASTVENLPPLLVALNNSVERAFAGEPSLDDLVKDSVSFFAAHDAFYEERERSYFVKNPTIDRVLKAGVAYLQGRATSEAVHSRVPDAALAVDSIHTLYLETREDLPEDMISGLTDGFGRAQKAFELIMDNPEEIPHEVLEEALFELRSAGELLEHLPVLLQRFEEENSSAIPIVGDLLVHIRNTEEDPPFDLLQEKAFPAFLDLWESRQDAWLLHPEVAEELLEETNQLVFDLADQVEAYPEVEEEEFWTAVDQLEEAFVQIKENVLDLDGLRNSPFWPEAQLLLNLLTGAAPFYAAQTISAGIREGGDEPPEALKLVGEALEDFLAEPHPIPLLQGLQCLAEDFELSKTSRPCASCGARIALEAKKCPECEAKVEEFSLSG